jgi:hypothetical protein
MEDSSVSPCGSLPLSVRFKNRVTHFKIVSLLASLFLFSIPFIVQRVSGPNFSVLERIPSLSRLKGSVSSWCFFFVAMIQASLFFLRAALS